MDCSAVLADGIVGASIVEIPECPHCLPIEKPTEFPAAVRSRVEIPP